MRKNSAIILGCALAFAVGMTATVWAQVTPEEIAKLGNELTPMGAIKAGNAEGRWALEPARGLGEGHALHRSIRG